MDLPQNTQSNTTDVEKQILAHIVTEVPVEIDVIINKFKNIFFH